jgi:hypothetical protein
MGRGSNNLLYGNKNNNLLRDQEIEQEMMLEIKNSIDDLIWVYNLEQAVDQFSGKKSLSYTGVQFINYLTEKLISYSYPAGNPFFNSDIPESEDKILIKEKVYQFIYQYKEQLNNKDNFKELLIHQLNYPGTSLEIDSRIEVNLRSMFVHSVLSIPKSRAYIFSKMISNRKSKRYHFLTVDSKKLCNNKSFNHKIADLTSEYDHPPDKNAFCLNCLKKSETSDQPLLEVPMSYSLFSKEIYRQIAEALMEDSNYSSEKEAFFVYQNKFISSYLADKIIERGEQEGLLNNKQKNFLEGKLAKQFTSATDREFFKEIPAVNILDHYQ